MSSFHSEEKEDLGSPKGLYFAVAFELVYKWSGVRDNKVAKSACDTRFFGVTNSKADYEELQSGWMGNQMENEASH